VYHSVEVPAPVISSLGETGRLYLYIGTDALEDIGTGMSTYFGASSKLPTMTLVVSSLFFRRLRIYTQIITVFTFMKWPGKDHDTPRHDDVPGVEDQWPSGSGAHRRTWRRYLRETTDSGGPFHMRMWVPGVC